MLQYRSSKRRFQEYRTQAKALQRGEEVDEKAKPYVGRRRSKHRNRTFFALLREFLKLLKGHRSLFLWSLAGLTISTLLGLIPPYIPKIVVDNVIDQQPMPGWASWLPDVTSPQLLLVALVVVSVTAAAFSTAFGVWSRWQSTKTAKRLQVDFRRKVFNHASRLPLHRVYDLKSGGLTSILRDDAGAVGDLLFSMLYNPWRAVTQLVGSMVILAWVDWRLLVGALVLLPIVWFTHRTWIARIRPLWRDVRNSRRVVDSHATEAFGGMRVVRGFGRQTGEAASFVRNNNMMIRQELFAWWWMRGVDTAWQVLIPAASALLLLYGANRIIADRAAIAAGTLAEDAALTVGELFIFMTYLLSLLGPIQMLASTANGLQNSLAGLDRVIDLLEEPQEMPSSPDALQVSAATVRGAVRLEHVGFRYPETDEPALRDIDLDVKAGQVVALVGSSGAGKSTLCNLIARFYDPTEGRILLDGTDLRDIDVESYRKVLGIVEQDIFLFDGTVSDNIGYAKRDATQAQIVEAARLANADEFIVDLQDGYDTWIGERGVKLSGGQRQRLAIARAILADPRILILDEATSNLDTESERLIQASLRTLMHERTSFVIAHRLSTIQDANQIVVLEHGRIIETGSHRELMERSGRYRQMVLLQTTPLDAEPVEAGMEG